MPRADDFDSVIEDENPNRGTHQIISMHQGIDQQLFEHNVRDLCHTRRIHSAPSLHLMQVSHDEAERIVEHLAHGA